MVSEVSRQRLVDEFARISLLHSSLTKTGKQTKDFPQLVELVLNQTINSIMFPAGLCSRRQNELSKILNGGKLLWPKVYSLNEMFNWFILMDATRIFSIIGHCLQRCWALSLISLFIFGRRNV